MQLHQPSWPLQTQIANRLSHLVAKCTSASLVASMKVQLALFLVCPCHSRSSRKTITAAMSEAGAGHFGPDNRRPARLRVDTALRRSFFSSQSLTPDAHFGQPARFAFDWVVMAAGVGATPAPRARAARDRASTVDFLLAAACVVGVAATLLAARRFGSSSDTSQSQGPDTRRPAAAGSQAGLVWSDR